MADTPTLFAGIENLDQIELPMAANESAPLLAFVASATASTAGAGIKATAGAVSKAVESAGSAADRVVAAADRGVAGLGVDAPAEGENIARSKSPELQIQKDTGIPENAQSAALAAVAPVKEQMNEINQQQGQDTHLEAAVNMNQGAAISSAVRTQAQSMSI